MRRRFPRLGWLGGAVMLAGLGLDAYVHATSHVVAGAFTAPAHGAHLVVLVGMVLVLSGVVIDGVRTSKGRDLRPEGGSRAVR
jgi:hypothetical protein